MPSGISALSCTAEKRVSLAPSEAHIRYKQHNMSAYELSEMMCSTWHPAGDPGVTG
jgi:hypothetical protein